MVEEGVSAVVLTTRGSIRDASRAGLKLAGINEEDIAYPEKLKDCFAALEKRTKCVVIVDWEFGAENVIMVLKLARENHQLETRVTFLIAAKMNEKIIAAGMEYGVARVHTGDVTKEKIKIIIEELVGEVNHLTPLKKLLVGVSEARNNGNWPQATKILEQLHSKDSKNPRLILELAENYVHEGRWEDAMKVLEPTKSELNPNPRCLHLIGKCLLKMNKNDAAIEAMRKAKMINPFNVDRLLELGDTLLNLDRSGEASDVFDEAIAIAPRNAAAKKGKGTCLLMDGDVNEALSLLKNAITGIELASVFNTAAVLTMRSGRIPEGMDLYDAAVKALKDQKTVLARIYYNKGIGFYRWKKLEEAISCFEKAIEFDPAFHNARHNLAALTGKPLPVDTKAANANKTTTSAPAATTPPPMANIKFDDSIDPFASKLKDELSDEDEYL